jgi:AcrR family transcriptional regulator
MATGPDARGGPARRTRKYEKRVRAEQEAVTRDRITGAALELLQAGGPIAVTVSAVARKAGVQRMTVYRHFPRGTGLVEACTSAQRQRHPPPDPAAWAATSDPARRLRRALRRIYRHYRETSGLPLNHPSDSERDDAGDATTSSQDPWLEGVLGTLTPGWSARGGRTDVLEAALQLAVSFQTWRSLGLAGGLDDKTAARLMVRLIRAVARKAR